LEERRRMWRRAQKEGKRRAETGRFEERRRREQKGGGEIAESGKEVKRREKC
jgi:hypothetical protein